jgi:hypothetical protein
VDLLEIILRRAGLGSGGCGGSFFGGRHGG